MHDQTDQHLEGADNAPLSPSGLARKNAILTAMLEAGRRRRVRRRVWQGTGVCAAATAAVLTLIALPAPKQPQLSTDKTKPAVVEPTHAVPIARRDRVVVAYADKPAREGGPAGTPTARRSLSVQQLSDEDLAAVLAGQTTYGIVHVQGRVMVLTNPASAETRTPRH